MFSIMLFASRASSLCKHGLGNLLRLNVKTLERVPAPSSLAKLKDLHPWVSSTRLQYMEVYGICRSSFYKKTYKVILRELVSCSSPG